ncbi:pseudouridylate synthase, putative [Ricinus communis]|uniref:tRNA pseudouridine synthase n=1 Tax=Ricinus communis TaxID=3988 RepID=B9TJ99_RICCO|nr:pseudouridylate synthase, putative [Ricinus communis]
MVSEIQSYGLLGLGWLGVDHRMADMRVVLGLEYDGSRFCGWQSQPSGAAVQDCLQTALAQMAGHEVKVSAAGRTDAGVHALSQVAHFDTAVTRPQNAWVRGVNAFLPTGVRVLWASEVDVEFHARFSAERRSYQYVLQVSPVAPAVLSGKVGWYHRPLDLKAMRNAASILLGEHDFSAFRASECQAKTPIKHLIQADIRQFDNVILFEFTASAFLHHMVRNLVGSLVYVGKGEHPPEWMRTLLEQKDRRLAAPTFMPDGLYLTGVHYDPRWNLPTCHRTVPLG